MRSAIAAGPIGIGAGRPKNGIRWPVPVMSRSIAVMTISCSCRAWVTLRRPPRCRGNTLIPRRALVSRYHSKRALGSSSSANRLTGETVADQIALAHRAGMRKVLQAIHVHQRAHGFDIHTRQHHQVGVSLGMVAKVHPRQLPQLDRRELWANDGEVVIQPRPRER